MTLSAIEAHCIEKTLADLERWPRVQNAAAKVLEAVSSATSGSYTEVAVD